MLMYELQFGKVLSSEDDICRISIRFTARERKRFKALEKIVFNALLYTARLLLLVIAVLSIWFLVCASIIIFG